MSRRSISSGSPWEPAVGYSRAVRVGAHVFVAGTTATETSGTVIGAHDAYIQARHIFTKIERALREGGCTMNDVVRTRMYLRDIADAEKVGQAHREVLGSVLPAATMIEVSGFVTPDMLVEIEVDAIASDDAAS